MSRFELPFAVTRSYAGIVYSWADFRELDDAIEAAEAKVGRTQKLSMWVYDRRRNLTVATIDWRHDQVVVDRKDGLGGVGSITGRTDAGTHSAELVQDSGHGDAPMAAAGTTRMHGDAAATGDAPVGACREAPPGLGGPSPDSGGAS